MNKNSTCAFLAFAFFIFLFAVKPVFSNDEKKSIGVVAGETVNQVRNTTETSYQATSKEVKETAREMEDSWQKFSESARKEWGQAMKSMQETLENLRVALNREYVKFKQITQSPKQT